MSAQVSFPKHKIKIVLLENIHQKAVEKLSEAGYSVKQVPRALTEAELMEEIEDAHVLGIRSKTRVTAKHLANASKLMLVGCFGVGTNQVALEAATTAGVPVFNAPYASTRSVAELAIANVIMLARRAEDGSRKMHQGRWEKSAKGCFEVRNKVIGLIGYGHIGQQVGLMAEALGMQVIFYDSYKKLPLGNSRPVSDIKELFTSADFISLHVPAGPKGAVLIGKAELSLIKQGSYLINLSRGSLIDMPALKEALVTKHLAGAALDVFPQEPESNSAAFQCELAGLDNVILTPHIGGSTEEAQSNIGLEVAVSFVDYLDTGSTYGAVNFPHVSLPTQPETHRILNIHKNVPGVLSEVNKIISDLGANISAQSLATYKDIGYLVMDLNKDLSEEVKQEISRLSSNIKTRVLY